MKNIIISGISRGLGECLFQQLSMLTDVRLFAIGRHFSEKQKIIAEKTICFDFNDNDNGDFLQLMEKLPKSEPVIFISNVGTIEPIGKIGLLNDDELRKAVNINFITPMLICNRLVAYFPKLKIINITTGAANYPIEGWGAYCSTKCAMKMFLDVLSKQEKSQGLIEIIHVDPGVMDTEMQSKIRLSNEQDFPRLKEFKKYKTKGMLRLPKDVAASIIKEYIMQ